MTIFRPAAENHLLGTSIEQWLRYADAWIGTPHHHSNEKTKGCIYLTNEFMNDAIQRYQDMSKKMGVTYAIKITDNQRVIILNTL